MTTGNGIVAIRLRYDGSLSVKFPHRDKMSTVSRSQIGTHALEMEAH